MVIPMRKYRKQSDFPVNRSHPANQKESPRMCCVAIGIESDRRSARINS